MRDYSSTEEGKEVTRLARAFSRWVDDDAQSKVADPATSARVKEIGDWR